jgi:hypothetical protein
LLPLLSGLLCAQPVQPPAPTLNGRVEGKTYFGPTGTYRITIPVLPELGGTVNDTENVVTFEDQFNVHISIAAFAQDATQRWELSTRGIKDYLLFFFGEFVVADFQRMIPGASIESATFLPKTQGGALLAYTLLPGGSMFADRPGLSETAREKAAKRGNLLFVRDGFIYVISTELAERIIEGSSYDKTTEQEDQILKDRLFEILSRMTFIKPAAK